MSVTTLVRFVPSLITLPAACCLLRLSSVYFFLFFFFSSRRRHTRCLSDWSSDVCSSDCLAEYPTRGVIGGELKRLAELLQEATTPGLKPAEQVDRVVRYYLPVLKRTHRDDLPKRQKDLEHFTVITERYRSLDRLLADMALEPPGNSVGDVLATEREEEGL